ncbi:MAG: hypothetical protein RL217_548 [Pseudomonadota bacterium]|jgi:AcrR family transcriptional regulator
MSEANKTLKADERRSLTVQTVIELASEQNPSEISTTAIAERMGVTQGALFRHFPSKDAILEAVMSWVAERILARIDKAAQDNASPLSMLEAAFMAHIDFVTKHPGVPRLLFGELQRAGDTLPKRMVQMLIHQYRERLQRWFSQGMACGELSPKLDTQAAAVLFIGSIQGLVMQSLLANNPQLITQNAQAVWRIYRQGLIGDNHA